LRNILHKPLSGNLDAGKGDIVDRQGVAALAAYGEKSFAGELSIGFP